MEFPPGKKKNGSNESSGFTFVPKTQPQPPPQTHPAPQKQPPTAKPAHSLGGFTFVPKEPAQPPAPEPPKNSGPSKGGFIFVPKDPGQNPPPEQPKNSNSGPNSGAFTFVPKKPIQHNTQTPQVENRQQHPPQPKPVQNRPPPSEQLVQNRQAPAAKPAPSSEASTFVPKVPAQAALPKPVSAPDGFTYVPRVPVQPPLPAQPEQQEQPKPQGNPQKSQSTFEAKEKIIREVATPQPNSSKAQPPAPVHPVEPFPRQNHQPQFGQPRGGRANQNNKGPRGREHQPSNAFEPRRDGRGHNSENFEQLIDRIRQTKNTSLLELLVQDLEAPGRLQSLMKFLSEPFPDLEFEARVIAFFYDNQEIYSEKPILMLRRLVEERNQIRENLVKHMPTVVNWLLFLKKSATRNPMYILDMRVDLVTKFVTYLMGYKAKFDISIGEMEEKTKELMEKLADLKAWLEQMFDAQKPKISKPVAPVFKPAKVEPEAIKEDTSEYLTLSLKPTPADFMGPNKALQPMLVKGQFASLQQYLNRNFQLLREDFLESLREGVVTYKQFLDRQAGKNTDFRARIAGIRTFEGSVSGYKVTKRNAMLRVTIKKRATKNLSWVSKCFMNGSLIIISYDAFRTFECLVVKEKDEKEMELSVQRYGFASFFAGPVDPDTPLDRIYWHYGKKDLLLCESKVFFEAYFQVMKSLRAIKTIPFSEKILFGTTERILPRYLRTTININLANQIINNVVMRPGLSLDPNQALAIRETFRSDLMMIQGPPGTGKTFVGSLLAEILIKLREGGVLNGPVMLVCYTNHALDQFLEKIIPKTQKVLRIGGGTKSEIVKSFLFDNFRRTQKVRTSMPLGRFFDEQRELLERIRRSLESVEQRRFPLKSTLHQEDMRFKQEYFDHMQRVVSSVEDPSAFLQFIRARIGFLKEDIQVLLHILGVLDIDHLKALFLEMSADKKEELDDLEDQRAINEADIDYQNRMGDYEVEEEFEYEVPHHPAHHAEANPRNASVPELVKRFLVECRKKHNPMTLLDMQPMFEQKGDAQLGTYAEVFKDLDEKERRARGRKGGNLARKWKMWKKYSQNLTQQDPYEDFANGSDSAYRELNVLNRTIAAEYDAGYAALLRAFDFIGVTTTGVAKQKEFIERINPRVLIVEEAAEVLESHIITSITERCEHLILIGDHLQLRPRCSSHFLATKMNMQISLFERLCMNNLPFVQLNCQRRMRTQIADLTRLTYPHVQDGANVASYEPVKNLPNVLFFTHSWPESSDDSDSKLNEKEAEFVVAFVTMLLKMNYPASEITILSLYVGQLLAVRRLMRGKEMMKGVRVATVDNFQGEENEIVIISLVRSNTGGKIGFLKESNRVNVALSRAKKGLFLVGNAKTLNTYIQNPENENGLWKNVLTMMTQRGLVKEHILVSCEKHNVQTTVKEVADFQKVPEGGCLNVCGVRKNCGHACERYCHFYEVTAKNSDGHSEARCVSKCGSQHGCEHSCSRQCFKCDKLCHEIINYVNPKCSHNYKIECHRRHEICREVCGRELKCGHPCKKECTESCQTLTPEMLAEGYLTSCKYMIKKKRPCGHEQKIPCGMNPVVYFSKKECDAKCEMQLPCGHECKSTCSICKNYSKFYQIATHPVCSQPCRKPLNCDHECQAFCCNKNHEVCQEKCGTMCRHSHCPKKCGEECVPCKEKCDNSCEHSQCSKFCYEICDRVCDVRCAEKLACGHQCIGLCGEVCPQVCRECSPQHEIFEVFFGHEDEPDATFVQLDCGHIVESKALDKWMNGKKEDLKDRMIEFKKCPKSCKREIRLVKRYQNIIKMTRLELNEVKKRINAMLQEDIMTNARIFEDIERFTQSFFFTTVVSKILPDFSKRSNDLKKVRNRIVQHYSIQALACFAKIFDAKNFAKHMNINLEASPSGVVAVEFPNFLNKNIDMFTGCVRDSLELLDFVFKSLNKDHFEIVSKRIQAIEVFLHLSLISVRSQFSQEFRKLAEQIKHQNFQISDQLFQKCKEKIASIYSIADIKAIIKGTGLEGLSWYKCPNGHLFAIGECGGAMQTSKCIECKATVGGTNHQTVSGVTVASELGGSSWRPNDLAYNQQAARNLQRQV